MRKAASNRPSASMPAEAASGRATMRVRLEKCLGGSHCTSAMFEAGASPRVRDAGACAGLFETMGR